jgi:RimJ/RimL family protein N-acetyltransferase
MKNPFLIGTKIYLRPLEYSDAPQLTTWINDPEVTRTLLAYRPMNLQTEQEFIDRMYRSEDDLVVGIVVRQTDQLIGVTGLHRIDWRNRHAALGILIGAKGEWGKGYGTEATSLLVDHAFATLNLNRVWLHVYEFNTRAVRAYEKVGFQKEGLLRQETFREGRYWDTIVMAVLRAEWAARRPPQR